MRHVIPNISVVLGVALLSAVCLAGEGSRIGRGVLVGYTTASADDEYIGLVLGSRWGMMLGGYVDYRVSSLISVGSGVHYINKGWALGRVVTARHPEPVDVTYHMDYLEIPIRLQINSPCSESVSPYVFGGVSLAYRVSEHALVEGDNLAVREDVHDYGVEDRGRFDVGQDYGAGVMLRIGAHGIASISIESLVTNGLVHLHHFRALAGCAVIETDIKNYTWSWVLRVGF